MRYIGSKVSTLSRLTDIVRNSAPDATSICDPFAGVCSVSRHFKRLGFRTCTGDLLRLSYVVQVASIGLNRFPRFRRLAASGVLRKGSAPPHVRTLTHLSAVPGRHGYLTENFSPAGSAGRLFFTPRNAAAIDAIRETIHEWSVWNLLTPREEAFLLATLIMSADKVANTAGTYYAHLKQISRKAAKHLLLTPLPVINNGVCNSCHLADAVSVTALSDADILYLDPPYNDRDYSRYYHLPETIVWGDDSEPQGKSGVPHTRRTPVSDFSVRSRAGPALEGLLRVSRAKYIAVHYTPRGLVPHETILAILESLGRTRFEDVRVRKYSATRKYDGSGQTTHRIYWCQPATRAGVRR
jgi:adenine-specific DNA-methyltransferase